MLWSLIRPLIGEGVAEDGDVLGIDHLDAPPPIWRYS
jgi:hypothetical protein